MTIESIRFRLKDWGKFRREGWNPQLGFASKNTLYRVWKEGAGASQATGEAVDDIPEDIQQMDLYIANLPGRLKNALVLTYEKRLSLRKAAELAETSKDSFRSELRQAEQRVCGFIERENNLTEGVA